MSPQTQTFYLFFVWVVVSVREVQRYTTRVVSVLYEVWGVHWGVRDCTCVRVRVRCVFVHVCVVRCMFVNVRDCDCDIVGVCACATSCTHAYIYLTRVSKETNTLDKDIDLYREYTFVYSLYIKTYITELLGNSLIYVRFIYTQIAEQFKYIR